VGVQFGDVAAEKRYVQNVLYCKVRVLDSRTVLLQYH